MASSMIISFALLACTLYLINGTSSTQLTPKFYSQSCPKVFEVVQSVVHAAVAKERRMGASLLRLHFHDCFVNEEETPKPPTFPPPTSSLNNLTTTFQAVGLSTNEMVALTGAHNIGKAQCINFRVRVYNESNIDPLFAVIRQSHCPPSTGSGDNNLAPLDVRTPARFDNLYYKNLIRQQGLLHSDQQLHSGGSTDSLMEQYGREPVSFKIDFAAAIVKMGDIRPLTGADGEIRRNCRVVNS
ncbi:hypothetical protein L1987_82570 [Smallanthus sonchifolius]|uniref:Uncharacterized protein n=1 Tax=Smallanthus sonchifolius TaxID=185202 RepID=A0ACB8YBM1_9ASTR|nr:hypothetical protein L1987_82570 [Smallanthus sonchifolius]